MKGDRRFTRAVELARLKKGDNILDLGSSGNILLNYLPKNVKYTAVDYEPAADAKSQKVAKYINFNLENGLPAQVKKEKYDVIFLLEIIEHIENFNSLLMECKKVLKNGGRIIVSTPTNNRFMLREPPTHFHCFRKKNLENIAKLLKMKCYISGAHIRIPFFDLFIPSNQTLYNDNFIMVLQNN